MDRHDGQLSDSIGRTVLQTVTQKLPIHDTDDLQQWLVETWANFQHSMTFDNGV